ncbi:MAG: hypothetical protein IPN34_14960 [Planctomycetes bacterium]|nr:hypothetical protein [Planctomycetota bacterium]
MTSAPKPRGVDLIVPVCFALTAACFMIGRQFALGAVFCALAGVFFANAVARRKKETESAAASAEASRRDRPS